MLSTATTLKKFLRFIQSMDPSVQAGAPSSPIDHTCLAANAYLTTLNNSAPSPLISISITIHSIHTSSSEERLPRKQNHNSLYSVQSHANPNSMIRLIPIQYSLPILLHNSIFCHLGTTHQMPSPFHPLSQPQYTHWLTSCHGSGSNIGWLAYWAGGWA